MAPSKGGRERKKPEDKLREKGKKESQVFTSSADNPRHTFAFVQSRLLC